MADIAEVYPSLLICGILHHKVIDLKEVLQVLESHWGEVISISNSYEFSSGSSYYEKDMGTPLFRCFAAFKDLVKPETLAEQKLLTQNLEKKWGSTHKIERPVNLDPGHITRGRMLLATTKDYAHRIYLHSGVYAEVTLTFKKNKVEPLPWTYPDIASGVWDKYLLECKQYYQENAKPLLLSQ